MILNIAKDYSKYPGGRLKINGEYSGEDFLSSTLEPKFRKALELNEHLTVILDGLMGSPSSFFEESFGGLVRLGLIVSEEDISNKIELVSKNNPMLVERIKEYIKEALDER